MLSTNKNFEESLCDSGRDSSVLNGFHNKNMNFNKSESGTFTVIEENHFCKELFESKLDNGGMSSNTLNAEGSDLENLKISKQDNFSIASFSSISSSSSSLSSIGLTVESVKRINSLTANQNLKSLETHNNNNNNNSNNNNNNSNNNNNEHSFQPLVHHKIRRVPSTANPKYRIPNLQKNQRSKSHPHVQINHLLNPQRRNSSPSNLNSKNVTNKLVKSIKQASSMPNFNYVYQHHPTQEPHTKNPQQIIYLQIPQPSQSQLSDPQGLQQQISSQLQLLVPQIYSQLINQINNSSKELHTVNMNINQVHAKEPSEDRDSRYSNKVLDSEFTIEQKSPEEMNAQTAMHEVYKKNSLHQQTLSSQEYVQNSDIKEVITENINEPKNLNVLDLNYLLKHIPLEDYQTHSSPESSYIEIKKFPGTPKIIIPLTEELILQCQQLQQLKESNFMPYQPKLETILEESLSVKHLKIDSFSKTKVVACIITVLCVIVVVLLAGDKTIAVAVVASVFILFLLGSTFYLYSHSTKREIENTFQRPENPRLQVNDYASRNHPSLA